jgi:hypothetical protein
VSTSAPPPQIQAAVNHFAKALAAAEKREIDPLTAPWTEIEQGVIKLLGGAFSPREAAHHNLAFMVGAALAERLRRDLGAFWFPNRTVPQGAALGFPSGIIVFSPFPTALQAMSRGRLTMLDEVTRELDQVTAQGRAENLGGGQTLGPDDYQRLFDPGFVQFVCLTPPAMQTLWARTAPQEMRELDDAFSRMPDRVPVEARKGLQRQLNDSMRRLDAARTIGELAGGAPQLIELLALVHAGGEATGFAPAELWEGVLLPLLHIGAATSFPPTDDEEVRQAFQQGAPAILVYVETVPYQTPAADEDGLLGVFPGDGVLLADAVFEKAETVRLNRVDPKILKDLAARFDATAVRASIERFREAGGGKPETPENGPSLLDVAMTLLTDLSRVVASAEEKGAYLCVRHATEAEAASEPLLDELRRVATGPRIILAGSF